MKTAGTKYEVRSLVKNADGSLSMIDTFFGGNDFVSYAGIKHEIEVDGGNVFTWSYKYPPSVDTFFVFVEGGQFPQYRHYDIRGAITEAERLNYITGKSTYVVYLGINPFEDDASPTIEVLGAEIKNLLKNLT